jgi:phytanoyl-CoA hydroxylase
MNNIDFDSVKKDYDRDGYVFLKSFLSKDEVEKINREFEDFIRNKVPSMPGNFVFYEDNSDPSTLKQLQDIHNYNSFFSGILKGSKFEEMAKVLLGENVIGKNVEYFNKPPKIGKPTPPHQDGYYFMLNPPQAITMWMALEDADEENGCVRYIQGSHLTGMRPHGRTKTFGFSQGITDYDAKDFANEIPFPAKPGDLLIHHAMTIHRADGNKSDRSRRALGLIYFGESAKENVEAKKTYMQTLSEESLAKEHAK